MAAVYSAEQDCLQQANTESVCSELREPVAQEPSQDNEVLSPTNTGFSPGLVVGSPALEAQDQEHQEEEEVNVTLNALVPQIQIKEEEMDDSEYITVHLNVAGDDSDEQTDRNEDCAARGESTDGDWPFRCEDCSEAFQNKEAYLEHRREHTHDGPIVCLDTDSQWDDLLVSTDGGQQTLCCALCGLTFSSSREFFTHQLTHRSKEINQQSIADTGQSFVTQKRFECRDCGETFTSGAQCVNHELSHEQTSKSVFHKLDHLKQSGETQKEVTGNEVTVKTENIPDTVFEQTDDSDKKLYECVCGRSFRTLCGLGTHQRFSTTCSDTRLKEETKRSFDCCECGKAFVSALALSCHQHWHKRREQLLSNGQKFKCKECGRVFTSLTFYNKHQRLAHTKEMPAKSFQQQVVHLQKKAFECPDCGLRFSRSSALQSHQICHTEDFNDIMEKTSKSSLVAQAPKSYLHEQNEADAFDVDNSQIDVLEKDFTIDSQDEDPELTHNGFEVISITASDDSGSESDSYQGQDPDLELVCESDQEEDFSFNISKVAETVSPPPINPEMNVKIVQIDYEDLGKRELVNTTEDMETPPPRESKKYDCPDCDRTFGKAVALRCHMLWHKGGMGRKSVFRRNAGVSPIRRIKCEICGHESFSKAAHYFHLGKHEDRKPYKSIMYQLANLQKNSFKCETCGMQFSRLSALHSHQQHHKSTKKPYACLQCKKSYATPSGLYAHQRVCRGKDGQEEKAGHFNPTKTLLGPKVHHCKKCGKGFWSVGALIHHKQYQCADAGIGSLESSAQTDKRRVKRKRRGRKRGIVNRKTSDESKEEYKCEVCGKSYRMLACFLKHQLIHDANSTPPPVKSFDYQLEQLKKNSYGCPECGKTFSRAMALQFHMKYHGYETGFPAERAQLSSNFGGPQCQTCHVFFDSESALQMHQKHCKEHQVEGQQEKVRKQNVLREDGTFQKQLSAHEKHMEPKKLLRIRPVDLKHTCDDCGRGFSFVGALKIHKRIYCKSNLFKSNSKLPITSQAKFKKYSAKFPFMCPECGRRFSTNAALGMHKKWHKDRRRQRARRSSSNNKISRISKGDKNFACNVCGKCFFYLCVLRQHQKYHTPAEAQPETGHQFITTDSAKSSLSFRDVKESFSSEAHHHASSSDVDDDDAKKLELPTLLGVQLSEEPIKPISPSEHSSTVSFKMIKTKEDKPKMKYQCSHCQKTFVNIRGVRAHKWQKHRRVRGRPPGSAYSGTKPLSCSGCAKRYSSHGALYNHERTCSAFTDEKKQVRPIKTQLVEGLSLLPRPIESAAKCLYKCHKCGKAFPSEAQLHTHKEAARTRPHSCALCCRGYWTESQLQQHLAWHDEVRRRLPTELRYRLNASSVSGPVTKLQASACSIGANYEPQTKISPAANMQSYNHHTSSTNALEQHQVVYADEGPYNCTLCPQTFGEIRDLIDHHQECLGDKERRVSSLPAASQNDDDGLTCIECGISFDQENDLHQHYIEHARGVF
ncbi:zinc finger protein 850 [Hoplias malabaricus]|uniref:zinc finger protein 850 n=1 Tax=Hoplias malabaricus TaxID=27720 RepID=UPI003462CB56